jgi:hypothetical protein
LINERFGRGWGWYSVGDLFLLNFLTLVTEFIGITLAADYIDIPRYVIVPFAAIALRGPSGSIRLRCKRHLRLGISIFPMRSAKVIAKAFSAAFECMVHRFCPVPVRCSDRVIK